MFAHRSNFRGFGEIFGNKEAFLFKKKNHVLNGNSFLKPVHKKKDSREKTLLKLQYGFDAIKLCICNKNNNIQDNGNMSDYKHRKIICLLCDIEYLGRDGFFYRGKRESVSVFGRL